MTPCKHDLWDETFVSAMDVFIDCLRPFFADGLACHCYQTLVPTSFMIQLDYHHYCLC